VKKTKKYEMGLIVARLFPGAVLFDPLTLQAYRIVVDRDQTVKLFGEAKSFTQRLAILHYAILHARDIHMVKQVSQDKYACNFKNAYFLQITNIEVVS
jgi:hypothetical protein